MSKLSRTESNTSAINANCNDDPRSGFPIRRSARGHAGMRFALVCESPAANSVTLWPRRTSSSVMYDTTRSVPPYSLGGTLSYRGAICAMRRCRRLPPPKFPLVSNFTSPHLLDGRTLQQQENSPCKRKQRFEVKGICAQKKRNLCHRFSQRRSRQCLERETRAVQWLLELRKFYAIGALRNESEITRTFDKQLMARSTRDRD